MLLHILFVQRKEDYPGEYVPEALEVVDEYAMAESPEWMEEKVKAAKATGEYAAVKVMEIEVSQDAVRSALIDAPRLDGTLIGEDGSPLVPLISKHRCNSDTYDGVTDEVLKEGTWCWWVRDVGFFKEQPTEAAIAVAKRKSKVSLIKHILEFRPKGATPEEICNQTGNSMSDMGALLRKMQEEGTIEKHGREWRLARKEESNEPDEATD